MSYGQTILKQFIQATIEGEFIENYRPVELCGLELDFYFQKYNFAIEFNGDQHYYPTSFGLPDKQIKNDKMKYALCMKHNITLITIEAIDLE
jgi:hypothetical protein